jgi:hypothetical protein
VFCSAVLYYAVLCYDVLLFCCSVVLLFCCTAVLLFCPFLCSCVIYCLSTLFYGHSVLVCFVPCSTYSACVLQWCFASLCLPFLPALQVLRCITPMVVLTGLNKIHGGR